MFVQNHLIYVVIDLEVRHMVQWPESPEAQSIKSNNMKELVVDCAASNTDFAAKKF